MGGTNRPKKLRPKLVLRLTGYLLARSGLHSTDQAELHTFDELRSNTNYSQDDSIHLWTSIAQFLWFYWDTLLVWGKISTAVFISQSLSKLVCLRIWPLNEGIRPIAIRGLSVSRFRNLRLVSVFDFTSPELIYPLPSRSGTNIDTMVDVGIMGWFGS
jgi:hypothetical protein